MEVKIAGPECTLSVRIFGEGVPILALHGFSDSGYSFSRLADQLDGYRIIAPDFRGHGKSEGAGLPFSIERLADDAQGVLEALANEMSFVIGHSMGAMAAITLAARTRVRALAVLGGALEVPADSAISLRTHVEDLLEVGPNTQEAMANWHRCEQPIPPDFANRLAQETGLLSAATWRAGLEALVNADVRRMACLVNDPAMVIYGANDPFFYPATQNRLSKALRSIRSVELKQSGHNPHWEYPEQVGTLLREFFRIN